MKAVIALSGLAGFVLFGPPAIRFVTHKHAHDHVTVTVHEVAHHVSAPNQSQCRYEAERSLEVEVGSGTELELLAGSGSLEVVGVEGLQEVRAVARACASHEEYLDDLQLTAQERGSVVLVETHYPDFSGRSGWGQRYARLDLRMEVPWGMVADIEDGSGEATLSNLGSLTLKDGSGELEIRNIMGFLRVDDGSGEIVVQEVQGPVTIEDGSGEIRLSSVAGDAEVRDSSGEVEIRGVQGNLTLWDSSGEIDVEDVGMDVRVLRDSSGDIRVDGVGGDFVVERDGSGSIRYRNVEGTVDVPRRRGEG